MYLSQWRQADSIRHLGKVTLAQEQDYTGLIVGCVCVSLLLLLLGTLLMWRRNKHIDDLSEVWYDGRGHIQHLDRLANARSVSPTNEMVSHESVDYRTTLLEGHRIGAAASSLNRPFLLAKRLFLVFEACKHHMYFPRYPLSALQKLLQLLLLDEATGHGAGLSSHSFTV
ncbi:hypothetical protein F2P81_006204 [Scophthalmus maximus]|uniref:Uncharacterized protein n=1 Tax=Scophthalmus maximus TaxID=52904 RepID=A0A6A4SYI8_SCOMX|nr:hypothetical protein F2P81_006204 [Scophthalmus maximus]